MTGYLVVLAVVWLHRRRARRRADAILTALSVRRHLEMILR